MKYDFHINKMYCKSEHVPTAQALSLSHWLNRYALYQRATPTNTFLGSTHRRERLKII